jgi:hypothetical protein
MSKFRVLINETPTTWTKASAALMAFLQTPDEAIAACTAIVDDELNTMWKPGTTANELYELYIPILSS